MAALAITRTRPRGDRVFGGRWGDDVVVDIVADHRARKLRDQGMSFREIAEQTGTSLTRVRRSLRGAPPGRMGREIRYEIRAAGGMGAWWRNR